MTYAIEQLLASDAELRALDVSRALMFHVGLYIREKTPVDFHVDCEYNKNLKDKKRLLYLKDLFGKAEERDVFPDILIHRRNSDDSNIVVIEIKKHGQNLDADYRKLSAFKEEPYSYTFAVQVVNGSPTSGVESKFL